MQKSPVLVIIFDINFSLAFGHYQSTTVSTIQLQRPIQTNKYDSNGLMLKTFIENKQTNAKQQLITQTSLQQGFESGLVNIMALDHRTLCTTC